MVLRYRRSRRRRQRRRTTSKTRRRSKKRYYTPKRRKGNRTKIKYDTFQTGYDTPLSTLPTTPATKTRRRQRYPIIIQRQEETPEYKKLVQDLKMSSERKAAKKLARMEKRQRQQQQQQETEISKPKPMNIPVHTLEQQQLHLIDKHKDDPALLYAKLQEAYDDHRYDPQTFLRRGQQQFEERRSVRKTNQQQQQQQQPMPLPPRPKPISMSTSIQPEPTPASKRGFYVQSQSDIIEKYQDDPTTLQTKLEENYEQRFNPQTFPVEFSDNDDSGFSSPQSETVNQEAFSTPVDSQELQSALEKV